MKILNTLKNTLKEILRSERGSFTFSITLISGQAVATTRYLPVQVGGGTTLVSGEVGWISVDQYGNLKLASGTQVGLSGLQVITQSGVWVIADVEVIVSSGLVVIVSGQPVAISGAPVGLVSGTLISSVMSIYSGLGVVPTSGIGVLVQTQSGGFVTLGSGVAVGASGLYVQISGQGVLISGQTIVGASGLYVQISGQGVLISGQGVLISGQTVVAASGLYVQISGQGVLISGQTVIGASGLYVQISGQGVTISGQTVVVASGLYVQMSGQGVTLGSGVAVVASGLAVILQSGLAVTVPTTVSGNVFLIADTSEQFPNSAGVRHLVKLLISNVVFIAGAASVNSGTGYMLAGDPMTDVGAQMDVKVNNLNKLYGIALTSGAPIAFLSFNF